MLGACLASGGGALAQSTTGSIYGSTPAETGLTLEVKSDSGLVRTVNVDSSGRYNIGSLPIGTYTVILRRGDQVIGTRENILLRVNTGTDVSFAGGASSNATNLETIQVTGSNAAKIDVTSVDSRTVFTSQDLQRLPIGRTAEAIALLSPGTVAGSGYFGQGNTVSFGGAGVSENAYYINGFNTGNPLSNIGGIGLPYGVIDQQEMYLGGYSARYGRSNGGVISQIGKSGTNEWHFGGSVIYQPKQLGAAPQSTYYPNKTLPTQAGTGTPYEWEDPTVPGTIYRDRHEDETGVNTYSLYAGGPLIEDRLFVFLAAEQQKTTGASTTNITTVGADNSSYQNHYDYNNPKIYGKINWNINDNNVLEYTYIKNNLRQGGSNYTYDYDDLKSGDFNGSYADTVKVNYHYDIFKYTGYLTDNLTLSALWGRSTRTNQRFNASNSPLLPRITGATLQDPAITGGNSIGNQNVSDAAIDGSDKTRGLRADLEWRIGDHTLTAGVDNMYFKAKNEGQSMDGNGERWTYGKVASGTSNVNSGLGVGPAGGDGYFVQRYIFSTATNMAVDQKAYFLEDRWQVTDKWLLSLGIRNDKFTNTNSAGESYVNSGNQWAPRLGASWDVFGDSSLKIYANLGRYYLALPNSVAIRGASSSLYTREYYTYTGIDANGIPTGLTPIELFDDSKVCPGTSYTVSSNGECGQAPDAKSFASTNLRSMYQDELIFGFDKTIGESWTAGAKVMYRKLQTAIDDICDPDRMATKLDAEGIDPDSVIIPGCVMFNPGYSNDFSLANTDGSGRTSLTMTKEDWGFNKKAKRNYFGVNLYVDHPFDGRWQGRIDYTWSRNFGNTEGQLKSDIGQTDVSKTQDWDAAAIMAYSGGYLANDRRHQLKAFGAYQIAPEWMASATLRVYSGTPKSCLGLFSIDGIDENSAAADPIGYGASYHTCAGLASAPGKAGRTPWTEILDLGLQYRPNFSDGKLALTMQVFNALNQQRPIQTDASFGNDSPYTVSNTWDMPLYYQQPRYVQFSVSYDF
jgi:outer membrane receptor protein involved in Fe transport